jgi:hypothetical protein
MGGDHLQPTGALMQSFWRAGFGRQAGESNRPKACLGVPVRQLGLMPPSTQRSTARKGDFMTNTGKNALVAVAVVAALLYFIEFRRSTSAPATSRSARPSEPSDAADKGADSPATMADGSVPASAAQPPSRSANPAPDESPPGPGASPEAVANLAAALQANSGRIGVPSVPTVGTGPSSIATLNLKDAPIQLTADLIKSWTGQKVTIAPSLSALKITFQLQQPTSVADAAAALLAAIAASNAAVNVVTAGDGSIQILDWNAPP